MVAKMIGGKSVKAKSMKIELKKLEQRLTNLRKCSSGGRPLPRCPPRR